MAGYVTNAETMVDHSISHQHVLVHSGPISGSYWQKNKAVIITPNFGLDILKVASL